MQRRSVLIIDTSLEIYVFLKSRYTVQDAPAPVSVHHSIQKICPGSLSFSFGGNALRFVEFLHVRVIHVIALGRPVHAGDPVQVTGDQLLAEEEGVICTLRQIVIADAEAPGIGKAAVAVKPILPSKSTAPKPRAVAFSRQ